MSDVVTAELMAERPDLDAGFVRQRSGSADLTAITPITLPEHVTGSAPEFSHTIGLSVDTFSTRLWRDGGELWTVWRLPPRTSC